MDSSKVIKASAGTGKTYRLSVEILTLLFQGVEIQEVLAVTFTRKATIEIRSRVIKHLDDLIDLFEDRSKESEGVLKELENKGCCLDLEKVISIKNALLIKKDKFRVMTIDAFINSIFSVLIAPYLHLEDFSLIDEALNDELIDEVLGVLLKDKTKKKKLDILIKLNKRAKDLSRYKMFIRFAVKNRFVLEKIALKKDSTNLVGISSLKHKIDSIIALIIQEKGSFAELINKNVFFGYDPNISEEKFLKLLKSNYKEMLRLNNFWHKRNVGDVTQTLEEIYVSFKEDLAGFIFEERIVPLTSELQELLAVILGSYDELKFRKKVFTYNDISYYTYKYLYDAENSLINLERGEVQNIFYEILSGKIRFLLIDEFQDTSVLQWNILFPLISEMVAGEDGGVICVGDDKQAIYGWRGGERELLNNLQEILFLSDDDLKVLNKSYRSSRSIISFINSFFSAIPEELAWGYQQVECHKQEMEGYVEVHVSKKESDEHELEDEIESIIARFSELLSEGRLTSKGSAILFRTNKGMEMAGVALKKRGISFVLESSASILEHKAIKPILYLLGFMVSAETAKLFDFVRSDYLNYSLQELGVLLNQYKESKKDISKIAPINEIKTFLDSIDVNEPVEQVVIRMLKHYGAGNIFTQIHDQKNIRRFIEIVRDIRLNLRDKLSIADLLRELYKKKGTEAFRQVGLESSDSVQLMTIHKSKGMEFDNVFYLWDLADKNNNMDDDYTVFSELNSKFNQVQEGFVVSPEDEIVIKNHKTKSRLYFAHKEKVFLEDINNLYVALTRAKQNLFLFCLVGKKYKEIDKQESIVGERKDDLYFIMKESLSSVCSNNARQLESIEDIAKEPLVIGKLTHLCLDKLDISSQEEKEFVSTSRQPGADGGSVTILKTFKESDHLFDKKIVFAKEAFISKQLEGSMIHEYLSCIYHDKAEEHDKAGKVLYQKYGAFYSKEEINLVCVKCKEFISVHQDIFKNELEVFNEHTVFDGTKEYRVDRIIIDNITKKVVIIDYKTGKEKDFNQLETYKKIIKAITNNSYKVETRFIEF